MAGTLYLVPNLLGVVPPAAVLPERTIDTARRLERWVVETPKAARAFVKSLDVPRRIADITIASLTEDSRGIVDTLQALDDGIDVGLLSDAGCPGVADPGAALVARAHDRGL